MEKMLKSRYFDVLLSSVIVLVIIAYTTFQNLAAQQAIVVYALDNNMKAVDYPHTIFWNKNSSIFFYIGVENRRWSPVDVLIKVKLISNESWNKGSEPCPTRSLLEIPLVLESGDSDIIPLKIDILEIVVEDDELIITKIDINSYEKFVHLPVKKENYLSVIAELWSSGDFTGQWIELKIRLEQAGS